MKPTKFPQSVKVLQRPSTMAENECHSLPVWCDGKQCVSCWKPTFAERIRIAIGGNVWLGVMSGNTQPPVFVSGKQVFAKASIKARIRAFVSQAKESIIDSAKNVYNCFKKPEKRKHFIAGFAISLLFGLFLPLLGLLLGCIAGVIKEWWDKNGHGTVELMDFVFTCIGAFAAFPFTLVIHSIV